MNRYKTKYFPEVIKNLSLKDFHTLSLEIDVDIEIPPEDMYTVVQDYFESLPWSFCLHF